MSDDFIGIYDNIVSTEYCNELIDHYTSLEKTGLTWRRSDEDLTMMDDAAISTAAFNTGECYLPTASALSLFTQTFWRSIYPDYSKKYAALKGLDKHQIYYLKIQKTGVGEGYHTWHCENGSRSESARIMAFILYLNDVDEGGETEFLYYHKRIKPKQGTLILFPAGYTHTHRGNPPLNGVKYILTGWVEL